MRSLFSAIVLLAIGGLSLPASAQTTVVGSIKMIRTGWDAEQFAVVTTEPIKNPAGCPAPDGYLADGSAPGYRTYYAAALAAYSLRQPIMIIIHDHQCDATRPKLIGINLFR
jgi:hypothetical protein